MLLPMRPLCLLLLSLFIVPIAEAEPRVFVSLAGTLLEAEITAVSGDNVTLLRIGDQPPLVVSRRTLCKEDNTYISRWAEEHVGQSAASPMPATASTAAPAGPAQKYRIVCQTLPSKSSRGSRGSGQRGFEFIYNFNLSNQEVTRDLQNGRGLALVLGRNSAEINGDLIVLQKEEFDVTIRAQSKMVYSTKPVRLVYNVDSDYPYGVKSYGYVLIIRDAAGNLVLVEASPDTSARYVKEILAINQVPCMIDREFRVKHQAFVPLDYISF